MLLSYGALGLDVLHDPMSAAEIGGIIDDADDVEDLIWSSISKALGLSGCAVKSAT
jgi:hypothetical protein